MAFTVATLAILSGYLVSYGNIMFKKFRLGHYEAGTWEKYNCLQKAWNIMMLTCVGPLVHIPQICVEMVSKLLSSTLQLLNCKEAQTNVEKWTLKVNTVLTGLNSSEIYAIDKA